MTWALPEWTVLGLLREQPRHGFAIATVTAADGKLGRIWQIPRPVIYRALGRLEQAELARPMAVESGPGPQRTVYAITDAGRGALDEWAEQPVEHVREVRSHLLMKLALLDRRGGDPEVLLRRQWVVLRRIVEGVAAERDRTSAAHDTFDPVLLAWRQAAAEAALRFVEEVRIG